MYCYKPGETILVLSAYNYIPMGIIYQCKLKLN